MAADDPSDEAWLRARLTRTEELIVIYEDAIAALGTSGNQTYQLDTGQTRQLVTKADLSSMRATLGELENRRATLRARLYGAGVHIVPNS